MVGDPFALALDELLGDAGAHAAAAIPPAWAELPRGTVIPLIAQGENGIVAPRLRREASWRAELDGARSPDALSLGADSLCALAHDLQGPLTAASGMIELCAADASASTETLRRVVASLHQLAAAQSLRARRIPREVHAGPCLALDALEGPLQVLAGEFRRRRVALSAPPPHPTLSLPVSEDVAVCALLQLAENALAAAQVGGSGASVVIGDEGDACVIRVDDDGPGLTDAERAHAGAWAWSTRGAGRGYGLWILRTLAFRLGGAVALSPRAPRGTSARFGVRRRAPR